MKLSKVTITISLIFTIQLAGANPNGAQVVHGSASVSSPTANVLNINNSHNAVINWQSFNIGAGQTTNFNQPSAASAVLNRVLSTNPSQILGKLNSNGKVFLINQHGILMGEGASINTSGFFASTLNMTDSDFLNGNLKFEGGGLGGIENQGYIHAGEGGNIVLIAPNIENDGVIEVDDGNIILAAGQSITISSMENPSIQFEVSSTGNKITNLGQIIANQGAASLFAGSLKHSGAIRATGLVQDADGTIRLVASGTNQVSGTVHATGEQGGRIEILGDTIELQDGALVDASGHQSGGEILIGGGQQGLNPDINNATSTSIAQHAQVHADATEHGKGGRVIVFAENDVHVHGEITARGGLNGGDGGFIETSGLDWLDITHVPDASATQGSAGEWLIDPNNITIAVGTGFNMTGGPNFNSTDNGPFLDAGLIVLALDAGNNVIVTTGTAGTSSDAGDINITASIQKTGNNSASLTFNAHNNINIGNSGGGNIDITSTTGVMDVTFNADIDGNDAGKIIFDTGSANSFPITIDTNGGTFSTNVDVVINGDVFNSFSAVNIINSLWQLPDHTSLNVNEDMTIDVPGSIFQNNGEIVIQNLATLDFSGDTLTLLPSSVLSGDGNINGSVDVNGGTILGGAGNDSFGQLTINGDLTFNHGLLYSVLGISSVLQSSFVSATSATINGGDLMLVWEDAIVPVDSISVFDGAKVQLLNCSTAGCLSGTGFNTVVNPITVLAGNYDLNTTVADALTYTLTTLVVSPNIVSWDGGGSDNLWSTGDNWSGNATPTSGDYVFLDEISGTAHIQVNTLETMAGLQSFEAIEILSGGNLTINGDGFILNDQEVDDGLLMFNAANARLSGSGVLYSGPGTKIDMIQGIIAKDIVNWGGIATTAGNSFQLDNNLVNNSLVSVDQSAGISGITGSIGTIFNNGIISFGNGGHLSLVDNIALTVTRDTAQFRGSGVLTLDNTAQFDVANPPVVFDSTINLEILGGTFSNAHNMTVLPDVIDWYSGVIAGNIGADFTLSSGQVLNLHGTADMLFSGGLTLDNNGTVNFFSSGGDFIIDGSFDNFGNLILNHSSDNAAFTGAGMLTHSGNTFDMISTHDFTIDLDIMSGADINIPNGNVIATSQVVLQSGSLDIGNGAIFTVGAGSRITLGSTFGGITGNGQLTVDLAGVFDFDVGPKDLSSLQSLNVTGGAVHNVQGALLPAIVNMSNNGLIRGGGSLSIPAVTQFNWVGGSLSGQDSTNTLSIDNNGTFDVSAGQALTLAFADFTNSATGTLTGAGQVQLPAMTQLIANFSVDIAEINLVGGSLVTNNFTYDGLLDWISGIVDGSGLTTTGQVNLFSGVLNTDWTITPTGIVDWTGQDTELLVINNATITNQGSFEIEIIPAAGVTQANKGFIGSVSAGFINQGFLIIDAGSKTVDFSSLPFDNDGGTIGIQSGTLALGQALVLDQSSDALMGFGTLVGDVENQQGLVTPGRNDPTAGIFQIGTLTIDGSYSQGSAGVLAIDLDSSLSGLQYDVLNVTGQLNAGGVIDFNLINGSSVLAAAALIDQSFKPLVFGSFSGQFDQANIPDGLNFTLGNNGAISILAANNFVDNISSQLEVLFSKDDLNHSDMVQTMKFIDSQVQLQRHDDEDDEIDAPRLVCK